MDQAPDGRRRVDTRYGVRLNHIEGCLIEHPRPGEVTAALALGGTIEGTWDHVRALWLLNSGVAGEVIRELAVLLHRSDPAAAGDLLERVKAELVASADSEAEPGRSGEQAPDQH